MKEIKMVVINDPAVLGMTVQEEAEMVEDTLRESYLLPVRLIRRSTSATSVIRTPEPDLVVVDYGGMSFGAYDTARSNIKYLMDWADNHPTKVLLVWTWHTSRIYKDELDAVFGGEEIANVFHAFTEDTPRSNMGLVASFIRAILGVELLPLGRIR